MTEAYASRIVDMVFNGFRKALVKDERIEIRGFGMFAIRDYGTYMGRNSRTGAKVEIKAKKQPVFKIGKELNGGMNRI